MSNRWVPFLLGAGLVAAVWAGFSFFGPPGPPVAPPPGGGPPAGGSPINLKYVGGGACVEVLPETIPVWKDKAGNNNRPQRATWFVDSSEKPPKVAKRLFQYEIAWKATGTNYLEGPYQIGCSGAPFVKSIKAPDVGSTSNLQWDYSVEVWSCAELEADPDADSLCTHDPRVDIMD